jgi:hypothetical protein
MVNPIYGDKIQNYRTPKLSQDNASLFCGGFEVCIV